MSNIMWTKTSISNQTGKIAIVTGANSGVGFETALALHQAGAHVVVACRSMKNAEEAITAILEKQGIGTLEIGSVDLSSLDSVYRFADDFKKTHDRLDLLINNAGIMTPPASQSAEGFELQFGANFLGHFALTGLLYPLLKNTDGSRIITLTSLAYTFGHIDFDNLRLEKPYDAQREYAQSKLADLLFTLELQDRIKEKGGEVLSLAAHPGVTQTNLARYMTKEAIDNAVNIFGELMMADQGALPTLFAAVDNSVEAGSLYGPDQDGGLRGFPAKVQLVANAFDKQTAVKLWEVAEAAIGIKFL